MKLSKHSIYELNNLEVIMYWTCQRFCALLVHAVEHHVLFSECGICWVDVALQVGPIMVGKESQSGSVWLLYMDWRIHLQSSLFDRLMHAIHEQLFCYILWTPQFLAVTFADVGTLQSITGIFQRECLSPLPVLSSFCFYSESDYCLSSFVYNCMNSFPFWNCNIQIFRPESSPCIFMQLLFT